VNKDQVFGKVKQAVGKVKQNVGETLGNEMSFNDSDCLAFAVRPGAAIPPPT
jgi:hypothetical protein